MKEIQLILKAYEKSKSQNQKTALATVVKVDGSAYRRPGARMLVTENGELTGAISGGCLEGDALRKAQAVIFQQKSMIVTYDTTDEDDQKFGVGLGCNGIIQILMEPINPDNPYNPIELLKKALASRAPGTLITVFSLKNKRNPQIGTFALWQDDLLLSDKIEDSTLMDKITSTTFPITQNQIKALDEALYVFFERVTSPTRLLLFGAGNDTIPMATMAYGLGWDVHVIDGRSANVTQDRFPHAHLLSVMAADEVEVKTDSNTVALLMTHNFEYEVLVLEKLAHSDLPYVGVLGPKKKSLKLIERLGEKGISLTKTNLYAPIGLDIGAEGSEEIAVAVLAEIIAVLREKQPIHLRDKKGPIHEDERN